MVSRNLLALNTVLTNLVDTKTKKGNFLKKHFSGKIATPPTTGNCHSEKTISQRGYSEIRAIDKTLVQNTGNNYSEGYYAKVL